MKSDILKLRIIKDLTYRMTGHETPLTKYDFDMFWDIIDELSAARQNELWDERTETERQKAE